MRLWRDELFGPVLSVMRASDVDEAITLLNRSPYGNMASIFTRSGKSAREFRRRAEAGMLGVNIGVAAPMAFFPFGRAQGVVLRRPARHRHGLRPLLHEHQGDDLAVGVVVGVLVAVGLER